jgi:CheY-like chemotaxis protein
VGVRQATLSSVARAIFIPFLPLHGLHSNRRDVSGWRLRQREGRMSLSVFVIEGDPTVAGFLVEVFSQQGWDVCVPRNGTGVAVTLLGDRRFDLITVSYRFPPTNGVEIIRLIGRGARPHSNADKAAITSEVVMSLPCRCPLNSLSGWALSQACGGNRRGLRWNRTTKTSTSRKPIWLTGQW